jgi:hypothetical protein
MHLHLGGALVILLILGIVLFPVFGWGLILWPVLLIAAAVGLIFGVRWLRRARARRHQRALALRQRIARLEADQGIPLLNEGTCAACGKPLIASARFCSYCRAPTERVAQVCEACGTRNAGDAEWCGACGAALPEAGAPSGPHGGFIAELLEWPLYR